MYTYIYMYIYIYTHIYIHVHILYICPYSNALNCPTAEGNAPGKVVGCLRSGSRVWGLPGLLDLVDNVTRVDQPSLSRVN